MFKAFGLFGCAIIIAFSLLPDARAANPPDEQQAASAPVVPTNQKAAASAASSPSSTLLDDLSKTGQFLSGVGVFIGALTAVATLIFVSVKQQRAAWLDSFRILYKEFWIDEDVTKVRHAIVNEEQYKKILPILQKRNSNPKINNLTAEENLFIEKIDRFCSTMLRIKSLGQTNKGEKQRQLWQNVYGDFWLGKMRHRQELMTYINTHWHGLFDDLPMDSDRKLLQKEE